MIPRKRSRLYLASGALSAALVIPWPGTLRAQSETPAFVDISTSVSTTAVSSNEPQRHLSDRRPASLYLGETGTLDLTDIDTVFSYVFSQLDEEITVYPTENYLYFRFNTDTKPIWGNIRLSPMDRDLGVLHFGYYQFHENLSGPNSADVHYHALNEGDGIVVQKQSVFRYSLFYEGKTVYLNLNKLAQTPPTLFALHADEEVLFKLQDESNIRFFLIYNNASRSFMYVVDEENGSLDQIEELGDTLIKDATSGFVFYVDPDFSSRKILIAIPSKNALQNNYYDGPFDQLADNFIDENSSLSKYIQQTYPHTRGRINQYGVFNDVPGARVAIQPYLHYEMPDELPALIDACRERQPGQTFYACITPDYQRESQLTVQGHHAGVTWAPHASVVSFPPTNNHVTGTSYPPHLVTSTFPPHQTGFTQGSHIVKVSYPEAHVPDVSFAEHTAKASFPSHDADVTFPNSHFTIASFPPHDAKISYPPNHYIGTSFPTPYSHMLGTSYPQHEIRRSFPPHQTGYSVANHVLAVSYPPAHVPDVSFAEHTAKASFPSHDADVTFPNSHFTIASFPPHDAKISYPPNHYIGTSFPTPYSHMLGTSYPQHEIRRSFPPHQTGYSVANHVLAVSYPPAHVPRVSFAPHRINVSFPTESGTSGLYHQLPLSPDPSPLNHSIKASVNSTRPPRTRLPSSSAGEADQVEAFHPDFTEVIRGSIRSDSVPIGVVK